MADGVSDVWFRVTDLEVASGSGCVVTTTDGHWWCSCEAGVSGKAVCWHRAAVYIAKLERNSGVRVVGPAAPLAKAAPVTLQPPTVRHSRREVAL